MTRIPDQRIATNTHPARPPRATLLGAVLGLALCALPAMVGGQPPNNPRSATGRLDSFLRDVNTLTANFKQTLIDEKGRILDDSTGIAYLKRPKQFRWEYQDPYRQTIVSDGERVWFHDHDLRQVIVKPWGSFAADTPAAILTMDRPLKEIFDIEDIEDEPQSTWQWAKLTPKSDEATFVSAYVGFGKKEIEVMKLIDSFGQTTWLVFSGLNANYELNPKFFSFTPPEGVDVMGADTGGSEE
uniref:Outer-membrane lipoprotein carrier protein n=1 Tax=Candidatus Kentrum sp. FM TaxID=2126340 RepID=A0A450TY65_9GAMM|nr:MAG: outer membrane lipoprotein carrier protein [Candidatus Kentron sp. FM]VFJ74523.1 MAG: outer membrane lipoprotein carrier protein [Candidatus Kentron sp. FM]VFK05931.1 MAG: outer membrane lipoprotein carrier protein [Candidatus Kentron sp. FM]